MKAIVNMSKDVSSVTSFLPTDVAAIGIWDSASLKAIDSEEKYQNEFNKIYTQEVESLKEHILITETGGDGNFKVTVNYNQGLDSNQKKILYKSSEGIKFTTSGTCGLGSPEHLGYMEDISIEKNNIDTFEISSGAYIVDAYSLLTRNENGDPQFLEFVFCIWNESKYPGDKNQIKSIGTALSLKYTKQ